MASKAMEEIVTKLAQKHGLDLAAAEAHLRLDMPGFERLVIEKIGPALVSVAHYYEQAGNLIADPRIAFFTDNTGWSPFEVTQVLGGQRTYALLTPDGEDIVLIDPHCQADLARFSQTWARNIQVQGWLEHGQKWDPCDPTKATPPDVATLAVWEADGGCEAIDGCWTEPDGTCPHGCPSWLLALGLI